MDSKKIAMWVGMGAIVIVVGVLVFFGAKNIVENMRANASNDVSTTYQNARYEYESAVLAKEQADKQKEQDSDASESLESEEPYSAGSNLVIEIIGNESSIDASSPDRLTDDANASSNNDSMNTPEADTDTTILSDLVLTEDGTYVYYIQAGDTLSDISAKLLYSVDELADYNQIKNIHLIYEGSVIRIPVNQED